MNSKLSWVDSHCHLDMLKEGIDTALAKGQEEGVAFCVTIGVDQLTNQKVHQYTQNYPQVYGTLGIHPHYAANFCADNLEWIRTAVRENPKIIGIGECGFDFHYGYSPDDAQEKAFIAQLELALELELPVVIHTREAEEQTRKVLDAFKDRGVTGVLHSFTSSLELAKYALDAGFYISFNGIATFPKSQAIREVLQYVPQDRILLETDAPYLTPVPLRGRPNTPAHVSLVGKFIADFLQIPAEELASQTLQNTLTLFPRITYER
ncbi:MAG: hydrolase TatD [SAR324 cluster bacterium]|uniref:Hydrolase TatD n=1 Tax=SAR324 cluster bacterium TaxID=2024889 RepID=A0A2A4T8P7_9DELT|nr:MAG: hydrolase TatD [SAR324 cluster bacterium]